MNIGKFSSLAASIIGAAFTAWTGLLAVNALPDNHWTHWTTVVLMGLQMFITKLAYSRTPDGTVVPPNVQAFIQRSAAAGQDITTFAAPPSPALAVSSNVERATSPTKDDNGQPI